MEEGITGQGVGVVEEVHQGRHDGLLVVDLVRGQVLAHRHEPPGAVDQSGPEVIGSASLPGGVQAVADGQGRRGETCDSTHD
jgi:hypothetical protein